MATLVATRALDRPRAYIALARPDHWLKNVAMLPGVLLAIFYQPRDFDTNMVPSIVWGVLATCAVASANYVLNEILDAPTDKYHPRKQHRPLAAGTIGVRPLWAYAEAVGLAALGLGLARTVNQSVTVACLLLLVMGIIYNVPPIRTKNLPYLDAVSESINNPIRLLLGWFLIVPTELPPVSLLLAYWMIGAFFMTAKRISEYRAIADAATARLYRASFGFYDEEKMLTGMFFYVTIFAIFFGIYIVRYHLELILFVPLIAGLVAYYTYIVFKRESLAQGPEQLHREPWLLFYLALCVVVFIGLMFVQIPALHAWFNVAPSPVPPLWSW